MHYHQIRGNLQRSQSLRLSPQNVSWNLYIVPHSTEFSLKTFQWNQQLFSLQTSKGHRNIKGSIVSLCKLEHIGRKSQTKKPFGETVLWCQGLLTLTILLLLVICLSSTMWEDFDLNNPTDQVISLPSKMWDDFDLNNFYNPTNHVISFSSKTWDDW